MPLIYYETANTFGYVETHTITKSFTHTITLDQFGSGSAGTFVLDVVGETHSRDEASGAGGGVTGATGLLTTDVNYRIVYSGQYSDGVFTTTSQSYTETGSATETHAYTIDTGSWTVATYDGDTTHTWNLSWSGTVTDGALSFTSYSNVESNLTNWHRREDYDDGGFHDHTVDTGFEITETGSGVEGSYTGREWWEEHIHDHVIEPIGPGSPPADYYYDDVSDTPLNGTGPLDTTPLEYEIAWNALEATAINYTWHGETEIGGTLTETATYDDSGLDVNSFNSTSHFKDEGHLIEDEPGIPESGTGTENAHRDETYTYTNDTTGSGSYVDGHADADYHAAEVATFTTQNAYTTNNQGSSGVDEEGEPYNLMFNFSSNGPANGSVSNSYDYHDGDDGLRLVNSAYSLTEGSTTNYRTWGTRNGVGFDESWVGTTGDSTSFSIPGDNVPITDPSGLGDAYPLVNLDSSLFLIQYGAYGTPPPPTGTGVLNAAVGRAPQLYYNTRIQQIGEDAKRKLGRMFGQMYVMQEVRVRQKMAGTFMVHPNENGIPPGGTYSQAVGQWKQFKKREDQAIAWMKKNNWTNPKVIADVEMTYYVEPAPAPGQNRSGKCVVEWRYIIRISGTRPNGTPGSHVYNGDLAGNGWFEDDNLKTIALNP